MCYLEKKEYRILPVTGYKILRGCPGCGGRSAYGSTGNFRVNANGRQIDVWMIYRCEKCGYTYNLALYERVSRKDIPREEYRQFLENHPAAALWWGTRKEVFARNRAEIDLEGISYEIIPIENGEKAQGDKARDWQKTEGQGNTEEPETEEEGEGLEEPGAEEGRKAAEETGISEERKRPENPEATEKQKLSGKRLIIIHNPYELKIRTDKVAAEILLSEGIFLSETGCRMTRSRFRRLVKEGKISLPQNYIGRRTELELAEGTGL